MPFAVIGPVTATNSTGQTVQESYTLTLVRGNRRTGAASPVLSGIGASRFRKPIDNIGSNSIANYAAYAASHITDIVIPGCTPPVGTSARVFVGQRSESSVANRGQLHDLFNLDLDAATRQTRSGLWIRAPTRTRRILQPARPQPGAIPAGVLRRRALSFRGDCASSL